MLTPSSNTVLEPVSQAMLAGVPEVSVHFARFRVTEISLRDEASAQFQQARLLEAADLLADAKVDVIAWNGTSASWLGFDADRRLCEQIRGHSVGCQVDKAKDELSRNSCCDGMRLRLHGSGWNELGACSSW